MYIVKPIILSLLSDARHFFCCQPITVIFFVLCFKFNYYPTEVLRHFCENES